MTPLERVQRDIEGLAARRKNVRLSDIESILHQLQRLNYSVGVVRFAHGTRYTVGDAWPFTICDHNKGSSQIRPKYVDNFLDGMAQLGLYEG